MTSTDWTKGTEYATDWTKGTEYSTDWTKGTEYSTIWQGDAVSAGSILLQNGDEILLQDGSSKLLLQ